MEMIRRLVSANGGVSITQMLADVNGTKVCVESCGMWFYGTPIHEALTKAVARMEEEYNG